MPCPLPLCSRVQLQASGLRQLTLPGVTLPPRRKYGPPSLLEALPVLCGIEARRGWVFHRQETGERFAVLDDLHNRGAMIP